MGTYNFRSNDYLSLTYVVDVGDLADDPDFLEDCIERGVWDEGYEPTENELWEEAQYTANDWEEFAYTDAEHLLSKYSGSYFNLTLTSGYYQGMQILLESNLPDTFDCEEDREGALEEIAQVAELYLELIDQGWDGTDEDVAELVMQLTEEVNSIEVDDWDDPAHDWEE
jgi:hypothetical protein